MFAIAISNLSVEVHGLGETAVLGNRCRTTTPFSADTLAHFLLWSENVSSCKWQKGIVVKCYNSSQSIFYQFLLNAGGEHIEAIIHCTP